MLRLKPARQLRVGFSFGGRCGGVRRVAFGWLLLWGLALTGCQKPADAASATGNVPVSAAAVADANAAVVRYTYEVVKSWPHDRAAFTQGLVYRNGSFIESTGLNGQSTLREIEITSGRVMKQVALAPVYFAEGVAVLGGHAYQLTWQNRKGFVYDVDTFQAQKEFTYEGEGWGLTTDGQVLILSDGSARIRFIDPVNFAVQRTLTVTLEGRPLAALNELEFIKGEIFANVWQTDDIVRIDPATGNVRGVISFAGLLAPQERRADTDVLNGIAYDEKADRLFVTGKRWPKVFEVRLKARQ
jgi:glutamine cyclotransferase